MIPLTDNIKPRSNPYVNKGIIVVCVAVFVLQLFSPTRLMEFAFVPADIKQLFSPAAWASYGGGPLLLHVLARMLSSMFMHGDFLHIAFNMLFLWVFGDNIEDRLGHMRYLLFYLVTGIVAALAHSLWVWFDATPMVGASGAIAGVLGAYFVLFKSASIRSLVIIWIIPTIIELPAVLFIGLWFVFQLLPAIGSIGMSNGVAFMAHVGGFLMGYWLVKKMIPDPRFKSPPPPRVVDFRYE